MPDLLKTGSDWLAGQLKANCSQMVTYRRGAQSVVVAATIGRSQFEAVSEEGMVTRIESRDFLVQAAELILGGARVLPQRGDRVVETDGGVSHEHEVSAPDNENVFRFSDPYRTVLRIHTKQIGRA